VSDQLTDRYPYESGFRHEKDVAEVSHAYGRRGIERYCWLISPHDDLPITDDGRVKALHEIADLLSCQETKSEAVSLGIVPSCSRLLTAANPWVRQGASRVLASTPATHTLYILTITSR
jgi:hypothetical protein